MSEYAILGILQGIAEWLPISSEGILVLVQTNIFNHPNALEETIKMALFLHFGTFLAALIYFYKDVIALTIGLFRFSRESDENKKVISFLALSTIISGAMGLCLLKLLSEAIAHTSAAGHIVTLLIGGLLIGTGLVELKSSAKTKKTYKGLSDLSLKDSIILGITQGFAALPGFSRSGLTMSVLLLRKFDKAIALKLSFLMSLPIVLAGNILLHLNDFSVSGDALTGLFFAFIFGLLTIHLLLKVARKINFGYFMLLFGALTIISIFI